MVYLLVSVSCIIAFGKNAGTNAKGNGSGNILYNFPPDNYVVTVLCLALIVVVTLDYAIIIYPVVNIFLKIGRCESHPYARQILNVSTAAFVVIVVMFVPNLTDVFGLCG